MPEVITNFIYHFVFCVKMHSTICTEVLKSISPSPNIGPKLKYLIIISSRKNGETCYIIN